MLSHVCFAAVNGLDAYSVEVEVNDGYGDKIIVMISCIFPTHAMTVQRITLE
jgi:hypothetical protein